MSISPTIKKNGLNLLLAALFGAAVGWFSGTSQRTPEIITAKAEVTGGTGSGSPLKLNVTLTNGSLDPVSVDIIPRFYPGTIYIVGNRSCLALKTATFHKGLATGIMEGTQTRLEPGGSYHWDIDPKDLVDQSGNPVDLGTIKIEKIFCEPWVSWQDARGEIQKPLTIVTEVDAPQ